MTEKSTFKISLLVFVQWVITAGALAGGFGYATGIDNACTLQVNFAEYENTSADIFIDQNLTEGAILHLNYAVNHCDMFDAVKENCYFLNHELQIEYTNRCISIRNRLGNLTWSKLNIY